VPSRTRPYSHTDRTVDGQSREDLAARALAEDRAQRAAIQARSAREAEERRRAQEAAHFARQAAAAALSRQEAQQGRYQPEQEASYNTTHSAAVTVARETREDLAARALAHERARQANQERNRKELVERAQIEERRRTEADARAREEFKAQKRLQQERLLQMAQDANKRHSGREEAPESMRPPSQDYDLAQNVQMANRLLQNTARAPPFTPGGSRYSHGSGHDYRSREELGL